jgi:hypothetical protein
MRIAPRRRSPLTVVAVVAAPALLAAAGLAAQPPLARPQAAAVFERLKTLQGTWQGWSSKGWTETITLRLIANGSALEEESQFADDAGGKNRMASFYQLDGDRLLLTHYCEAGNTPRLVASGLQEPGPAVTFTFLDGVNLPSRDRGHMDKVVLRFEDGDHFSARWTWFQDGKEAWMEDVRYQRGPVAAVPTAPAGRAAPAPGR